MKYILLLLFSGLITDLSAQNDFDKRLLSKFSAENIETLREKNPLELEYMEFYLEHGISIISNDERKDIQTIAEVRLKTMDLSKINIFQLGLPLPLRLATYYSIQDTDQILVVHARENVMFAFNNIQKH